MKSCNYKQGETKKDKTFVGVILLIVGIILLGRNFHIFPAFITRIIFSWQMLIIGIGILMIVSKGKSVGGLFLIGIGSLFLWDKIVPFSHFQWQIAWPLLFIFVGAVLVLTYLGSSLKEIFKSNSGDEKPKVEKPKNHKKSYKDVEFDIDKIEPIED